MRYMKITIENSKKKNPPLQIEVADSFFARLRGLMGRRSLAPADGLLLVPCSSVHMCFMRFAIDVVYLDKDYHIRKIVPGLRPWIGVSWCSGAGSALELEAGRAAAEGIRVGQKLLLVNA